MSFVLFDLRLVEVAVKGGVGCVGTVVRITIFGGVLSFGAGRLLDCVVSDFGPTFRGRFGMGYAASPSQSVKGRAVVGGLGTCPAFTGVSRTDLRSSNGCVIAAMLFMPVDGVVPTYSVRNTASEGLFKAALSLGIASNAAQIAGTVGVHERAVEKAISCALGSKGTGLSNSLLVLALGKVSYGVLIAQDTCGPSGGALVVVVASVGFIHPKRSSAACPGVTTLIPYATQIANLIPVALTPPITTTRLGVGGALLGVQRATLAYGNGGVFSAYRGLSTRVRLTFLAQGIASVVRSTACAFSMSPIAVRARIAGGRATSLSAGGVQVLQRATLGNLQIGEKRCEALSNSLYRCCLVKAGDIAVRTGYFSKLILAVVYSLHTLQLASSVVLRVTTFTTRFLPFSLVSVVGNLAAGAMATTVLVGSMRLHWLHNGNHAVVECSGLALTVVLSPFSLLLNARPLFHQSLSSHPLLLQGSAALEGKEQGAAWSKKVSMW